MTALWIIGGILAFLGLVLSFSLVLGVEIGEETRFWAGAFGFRYKLDFSEKSPKKEEEPPPDEKQPEPSPDGKKKPPPDQAKKPPSKEAASPPRQPPPAAPSKTTKKQEREKLREEGRRLTQEPPSERTFGETVEFALRMAKAVLPGTRYLLSHLRITRMRAAISIGTDSADQTAIAYGAACTAAYNLLALLDGLLTLKVRSVDIQPDFITGESRYHISFRVKLRLACLLWGGLCILFQAVRVLIDKKPQRSKARPTQESR